MFLLIPEPAQNTKKVAFFKAKLNSKIDSCF